MSKIKTNWDLTPLLESENPEFINARLTDAIKACTAFDEKWGKNDSIFDDPRLLRQALDDLNELVMISGSDNFVGHYFGLKSSLDEANPNYKAWATKIEDATKESAVKLQKFLVKLSKTPSEKQKTLLSSAELLPYKQLLVDSFESGKYTLSEDAEKIMMFMATTSYANWVKMTSEFVASEEIVTIDSEGNKSRKNFSQLMSLLSNKEKNIRQAAARKVDSILKKNAKVAEAELNSVLEYKKVNDQLRGFKTADEEFSISNKVSLNVIDTLVDIVSKSNNIAHDYYALKTKLMEQPKLEYYEKNVQYGEFPGNYTFESGVKTVYETLNSLDSEFGEIFETFLYNGQVDVFPKKGKSGGAFVSPAGKSKPSYMLLNSTGIIDDVFTMAHEFGHAINYEYIRKHESALNFDNGLCLAETASTFFESFVVDKIAQSVDDKTKLALMLKDVEDAISTVFRQIACYKFERDLHNYYRERGFLSQDEIGSLFVKNMSAYLGPYVHMHSAAKYWWVYWSHIRSYFYVFSYAFGFLVSQYLQQMVHKNSNDIQKVKTYLSIGSSMRPEAVLRAMDIDITDSAFWEAGVSNIRNKLNDAKLLADKLHLA